MAEVRRAQAFTYKHQLPLRALHVLGCARDQSAPGDRSNESLEVTGVHFDQLAAMPRGR